MAAEKKRYEDRITADPKIMVGKPVVKGTRIPVELVLWHLAENPDLQDLFQAYPELTEADVQACLDYAAHVVNRAEARRVRLALQEADNHA